MSASTWTSVHSSVAVFFATGKISSVDMRYEHAIVPDRPFPAVIFRYYSGFWAGFTSQPLQWSTATRSLEPQRYECISLAIRGRTAIGGTLHPLQYTYRRRFRLYRSLMIREWVPAYATLKDRGRVRVFCYGTEVEHPVVLPMACIQEPLCIFASVSVKAFHTGCRVTHNDDSVRDVDEIFGAINPSEVTQMSGVLLR